MVSRRGWLPSLLAAAIALVGTTWSSSPAEIARADPPPQRVTLFTDSVGLYRTRLTELRQEHGEYGDRDAEIDVERRLLAVTTDHVRELTHPERKALHNLKYFTWVEQQGKTYEEIQAQWYERDYWTNFQKQIPEMDSLIEEFNADVGLG